MNSRDRGLLTLIPPSQLSWLEIPKTLLPNSFCIPKSPTSGSSGLDVFLRLKARKEQLERLPFQVRLASESWDLTLG